MGSVVGAIALPVTPIAAMPGTTAPIFESKLRSLDLSQRFVRPPVPPLPDVIPPPAAPDPQGIVGLVPRTGADLGVGHLRPANLTDLATGAIASSNLARADWLQEAAIPIYTEPNGLHWGWIINGWLVPNGQPAIALGRDASFSMLHTYSNLYSFPVHQIRDDGWFQFQYTPVGKAWAHVDHLNLGRLDLAIEQWESRFLQVGRVEFLNHGASQALYGSFGEAEEDLLGLVGGESLIEPLAFSGDWMQVRITQPVNGCEPLVGATVQQGWMRWRQPGQPSLIWYAPKGC